MSEQVFTFNEYDGRRLLSDSYRPERKAILRQSSLRSAGTQRTPKTCSTYFQYEDLTENKVMATISLAKTIRVFGIHVKMGDLLPIDWLLK